MDVGTYALSAVRQVLNREPVEVVHAEHRLLGDAMKGKSLEGQVDQFMTASLRTSDGKTASFAADIAYSFQWPSFLPETWRFNIPYPTVPMCHAILEEVTIDALPKFNGAVHHMQRTVTIWNYLVPTFWHRIDVSENHRIVKDGKVIKTWKETRYIKEYSRLDGEEGADWWTTWRCQFEEFIHRVKGRKGSGVWIDAQESVAQMATIDEIYRKTGLEIRPSSSYELPS